MQTRIDGTHDILPVADGSMAVPDHARVLVTWPRESDEKMRRDGSDAARGQPLYPVAERGGVHGAPELSPRMAEHISGKASILWSRRKEKRRCRILKRKEDRLGWQIKGRTLQLGRSVDFASIFHRFGNVRPWGATCAAPSICCLTTTFCAFLSAIAELPD